jgi:hypothetical protein
MPSRIMPKLTSRLTLAALLFAMGAAPAPHSKLVDILPSDVAFTKRALAIFQQKCAGLVKIAPLVDHIEVRDIATILFPEGGLHQWPIAVSVQVYIRDDALNNVASMGFVVPKVNQFMLGAGTEPGIVPMSPSASQLCYGSDIPFVAVPALSFLTHWPSDQDAD